MAGVKRKICTESDAHALHRELDEVSCPICMDHPHNAVLLLCTSHDNGCRSYICDTSYRHSNCLDQFKKIQSEFTTIPSDSGLGSNLDGSQHEGGTARRDSFNRLARTLDSEGEGILELNIGDSETLRRRVEQEQSEEEDPRANLKCPLCRGTVLGWKVLEEVRDYLNSKTRSCSRESCSFTGNYQELRRHARRVHPTTRPSDIDPSRERAWRRLEHQREYGDIVSAVRSAMPGAVVVGDYIIENGDRFSGERRENGNSGEINAPWWTTFFLFQMIGSLDHGGGSSGSDSRAHRSRAWRNHRRSSERRYLWGENLLGLQDEHDNGDEDLRILSDASDGMSPVPRRRRRLPRSRSGNGSPR
ncbi:PREDICTED: uncharacterized protein LOC104821642 [Tarenaya hassleriana]|uniref:uncharacterized protein LOC104821642 n=1 Tax=Tarenaya hassleriana TaxID=28532 RepID=UPI00053C5526|nr:PREDICTED: uncharacterized protein LOC104821642 [Tarenaya hassleriana]XP_010550874.1 PREDICTED: uncharacterized protein LOC104821642 [Tarenaya hassleriana]XP_010550875.1 PREDICTED: uncharacterized protein LOC104821642 [Tarenaya hassleriana]XP_010550877.1 PREDICTED: uncharacterized protein LOC104821642 [Tarenaya hassleriana]